MNNNQPEDIVLSYLQKHNKIAYKKILSIVDNLEDEMDLIQYFEDAPLKAVTFPYVYQDDLCAWFGADKRITFNFDKENKMLYIQPTISTMTADDLKKIVPELLKTLKSGVWFNLDKKVGETTIHKVKSYRQMVIWNFHSYDVIYKK